MVIDSLPPNVKLTGDAQEKIVNFQPFLCGSTWIPILSDVFQLQIFFLYFFVSKALDPDPDRYSA